jgi:hypothetical protein
MFINCLPDSNLQELKRSQEYDSPIDFILSVRLLDHIAKEILCEGCLEISEFKIEKSH